MEYSFFPEKNQNFSTKIQNFKQKMLVLVFFNVLYPYIPSYIGYWLIFIMFVIPTNGILNLTWQ